MIDHIISEPSGTCRAVRTSPVDITDTGAGLTLECSMARAVFWTQRELRLTVRSGPAWGTVALTMKTGAMARTGWLHTVHCGKQYWIQTLFLRITFRFLQWLLTNRSHNTTQYTQCLVVQWMYEISYPVPLKFTKQIVTTGVVHHIINEHVFLFFIFFIIPLFYHLKPNKVFLWNVLLEKCYNSLKYPTIKKSEIGKILFFYVLLTKATFI